MASSLSVPPSTGKFQRSHLGSMSIEPPKYFVRFLRWFCRADFIDEIEGDLRELFEKKSAVSPSGARLWFAWSTLRYFRPEYIRSFNPQYSTIMFRHNLLISWRTFVRYKRSFLINLVGLSTGLACVLLILLWVSDELAV